MHEYTNNLFDVFVRFSICLFMLPKCLKEKIRNVILITDSCCSSAFNYYV